MTNKVLLTAKNSTLTIEGTSTSEGGFYSDYHYVIPTGASRSSAFRKSDFDVTPLVDPIVLPTGKNAVVAIGNNVYRKSGAGYDVWFLFNGNKRTTAVLTEKANAKADSYRVVFEGE